MLQQPGREEEKEGDDKFLGEAQVPFSLLKQLPFHYLPLRVSRSISPCLATNYGAGDTPRSNTELKYYDPECYGDRNRANYGEDIGGLARGDCALLGIGLTMIFTNPTVLDSPSASDMEDSSLGAVHVVPARADKDGGKVSERNTCSSADGAGLLLKIHEAENLVSVAVKSHL